MFTLDEHTVFYYFRSTSKKPQNPSGVIKGWAAGVKPGLPPKRAASIRSASTSTAVTKSTLTDGVAIISAKSKADALGGISDEDEMVGEERLAAVDSPFKGKNRAASNVSIISSFYWCICMLSIST
jgi:hypothetical protein